MINTEKTKIRKWKYIMLIPVFSAGFLMASAQNQVNLESTVYSEVDQRATPKNDENVVRFIQKNIKYPSEARRMKEQGKVFVALVVEKDGALTNPQIVQSISPSLDAEALRVASMLTPWNPARNKGEAVRMKMILPIEFILDGIPKPQRPIPELDGVRMSTVTIVGYAAQY